MAEPDTVNDKVFYDEVTWHFFKGLNILGGLNQGSSIFGISIGEFTKPLVVGSPFAHADAFLAFNPINLEPMTIDAIACFVQTAGAGSSYRMGLYECQANKRVPGKLIVDAGTVDSSTTGVKTLILPTPLRWNGGTLFLAGVSQGGTPPAITQSSAPEIRVAGLGGSLNSFLAQTGVNGALPANAVFNSSTGLAPYLFLRAS